MLTDISPINFFNITQETQIFVEDADLLSNESMHKLRMLVLNSDMKSGLLSDIGVVIKGKTKYEISRMSELKGSDDEFGFMIIHIRIL